MRSESLFARIQSVRDLDRPAVVSPDGSVTYGELLRRAQRLSALLADRRSPVLVYGHKQPAMVVAFVAALRRFRPYVPVDPSSPPARIARMLEIARPGDVILAQPPPPELAAELVAREINCIAVDAVAANVEHARDLDDAPAPIGAENRSGIPAYILFTSGTSGDPKGVPVPHRALEHFTDWLLEAHRFAASAETFLNQAPFSFDLSVMDLYGALLSGGTLFCITRDEIADPRRLFARLDRAPLTVWVSTPSFARFCVAEPRFSQSMLPSLRHFLFCGETLPPGLARELLRRFPEAEVWNTYGPTETTVAVTGVRIDAAMAETDQPLPIGRPFPGTDVWIADPDDPSGALEDGSSGEITIAGAQVALGYRLADGPGALSAVRTSFFTLPDGRPAYRTGDVGYVDPSTGLFYCGGRLDRQIKLHGYRLELEEIEACLRGVPGIADAAVLAVKRGGQPDYLVAFVVAESGEAKLPAGEFALGQFVRSALAERLPHYALPRAVRRLPSLPLTSNGKIDRRSLLGMLR